MNNSLKCSLDKKSVMKVNDLTALSADTQQDQVMETVATEG